MLEKLRAQDLTQLTSMFESINNQLNCRKTAAATKESACGIIARLFEKKVDSGSLSNCDKSWVHKPADELQVARASVAEVSWFELCVYRSTLSTLSIMRAPRAAQRVH